MESDFVREGVILGAVIDDDMPDTMIGATAFEEDLSAYLVLDPSTRRPKGPNCQGSTSLSWKQLDFEVECVKRRMSLV